MRSSSERAALLLARVGEEAPTTTRTCLSEHGAHLFGHGALRGPSLFSDRPIGCALAQKCQNGALCFAEVRAERTAARTQDTPDEAQQIGSRPETKAISRSSKRPRHGRLRHSEGIGNVLVRKPSPTQIRHGALARAEGPEGNRVRSILEGEVESASVRFGSFDHTPASRDQCSPHGKAILGGRTPSAGLLYGVRVAPKRLFQLGRLLGIRNMLDLPGGREDRDCIFRSPRAQSKSRLHMHADAMKRVVTLAG